MKKLVDLFAGCGGLSLGFEQAGFQVAFANDIDKDSCATYLTNRSITNQQMYIGDIENLNKSFNDYKDYLTDVDIVCGGPPCQSFSIANRQPMINDPRNHLYKAYLFFLNKVRPKFFVMENVKGMLKKINEIMKDFKETLGDEYDIDYCVVNARDFGVPQNRERLFVIGNRVGVDTKSIFSAIKSAKAKIFNLRDAIADLPILEPNTKKNVRREDECCGFTVKDFTYKKTDYYNWINNKRDINKLYNHKNRYNNERDIKIFSLLPQGENSLHSSIKDIMPYSNRNHIFKDKYYKLKYDEICKTITSHMKYDCNMYIHPTQSRGLSPREAARVQTFPDDYLFVGSQNNWYKQIGNAVPVKLAYAIGEQIIKWL